MIEPGLKSGQLVQMLSRDYKVGLPKLKVIEPE